MLARQAANDPDFIQAILSIGGSPEQLEAWTREHYAYRPEVEEIIRTPQFMMSDLRTQGFIEGDCDDVSTFLAAALAALGYPVRFAAIRYTPYQPNYEHVFVEWRNGVTWNVIDATVPPGTEHVELERMIQMV